MAYVQVRDNLALALATLEGARFRDRRRIIADWRVAAAAAGNGAFIAWLDVVAVGRTASTPKTVSPEMAKRFELAIAKLKSYKSVGALAFSKIRMKDGTVMTEAKLADVLAGRMANAPKLAANFVRDEITTVYTMDPAAVAIWPTLQSFTKAGYWAAFDILSGKSADNEFFPEDIGRFAGSAMLKLVKDGAELRTVTKSYFNDDGEVDSRTVQQKHRLMGEISDYVVMGGSTDAEVVARYKALVLSACNIEFQGSFRVGVCEDVAGTTDVLSKCVAIVNHYILLNGGNSTGLYFKTKKVIDEKNASKVIEGIKKKKAPKVST